MTTDSNWLELLVEQIPDEADRVLFGEAVTAAQAGAARLAVVGAWLAVAESLKRRFERLALGDDAAGLVVKRIRELEGKQRSVDRYLVERAHEYGMTSVVEDQALGHLLDARNIFAHPYSEQPTSEDVRAALAKAVEHLLSRPLLLRHRFVDEEVERVVSRRSWIRDSRAAVHERIHVVLSRTDRSVHGALIPALLKSTEPRQSEPDFVNGALGRRVWWALDSLCELLEESNLPDSQVEPIIASFPRTGSLVLSHPRVLERLSGHPRDAAFGELCAAVPASVPHLSRLLELRASSSLSVEEASHLQASLDLCATDELVEAGAPLETYAARLVTELASHNWYVQNPAADVLRLAGSTGIAELNEDLQEALGRNVLQSADGAARSSLAFIQEIGEDAPSWPDSFLYGIAAECFANERGQFRVKAAQLVPALWCVAALTDQRRALLVTRLHTLIINTDYWGGADLESAATSVEAALGENSALADAIRHKPEPDLPF